MWKNLSQLTSADAVEEAIAECEKLGRDVFLKKYGYGYSRLYPLRYKGGVYDSKAIAGVAFGKQHGSPLKSNQFSGGVNTVIPVLEKLGFSVSETPNPAAYLVRGNKYFRKNLVELFGGQLQAGIWTPKEFPVIFIFSGDSGKPYGYEDGWTDSGVFQYTGEGQKGDMVFSSGNKAIRDHRQNGKDLLLFDDLGKGKGVRFSGLFECASWRRVDGVDKAKNKRSLIVFDLVPVRTAANNGEVMGSGWSPNSKESLQKLRKAAYAASSNTQAESRASEAMRTWYERSAKVRDYVLARANGVCEACDRDAPFLKRNGMPYLEPHHTKRLADEGPDHPAWVGAICPTCHRRIHSGADGGAWNDGLQLRLTAKESSEL